MSTRFALSAAVALAGGPAADADPGSNTYTNTSRDNPVHTNADAAADRNSHPATDPDAGTNAAPDPDSNAAPVGNATPDTAPHAGVDTGTKRIANAGTDRHSGCDAGADRCADAGTLARGVSRAYDRTDSAATDTTATHTAAHNAADAGRAADSRPGCAGATGSRPVGGGALRQRRQSARCGPADRDHGHLPRAEPAERAAQLPRHGRV